NSAYGLGVRGEDDLAADFTVRILVGVKVQVPQALRQIVVLVLSQRCPAADRAVIGPCQRNDGVGLGALAGRTMEVSGGHRPGQVLVGNNPGKDLGVGVVGGIESARALGIGGRGFLGRGQFGHEFDLVG